MSCGKYQDSKDLKENKKLFLQFNVLKTAFQSQLQDRWINQVMNHFSFGERYLKVQFNVVPSLYKSLQCKPFKRSGFEINSVKASLLFGGSIVSLKNNLVWRQLSTMINKNLFHNKTAQAEKERRFLSLLLPGCSLQLGRFWDYIDLPK